MNWNQVEGNWEQFKGKVQTQWGKLTGDDLDVIKGKRKELRRQDPGALRQGPGRRRARGRRLVQPPELGRSTDWRTTKAPRRRGFFLWAPHRTADPATVELRRALDAQREQPTTAR